MGRRRGEKGKGRREEGRAREIEHVTLKVSARVVRGRVQSPSPSRARAGKSAQCKTKNQREHSWCTFNKDSCNYTRDTSRSRWDMSLVKLGPLELERPAHHANKNDTKPRDFIVLHSRCGACPWIASVIETHAECLPQGLDVHVHMISC